jgi:hypothetical protein
MYGLGALDLSKIPYDFKPWHSINEMLMVMTAQQRAEQTDLDPAELRQLFNMGLDDEVWPARGGPWRASYQFGAPSGYKISDFDAETAALMQQFGAPEVGGMPPAPYSSDSPAAYQDPVIYSNPYYNTQASGVPQMNAPASVKIGRASCRERV